MSDRPYSRRHFLASLGLAGAGVALTGCPRDRPADPVNGPTVEDPPPVEAPRDAPVEGQVIAADCPGYDQLTEDELLVRRTLDYVDVTPNPGEYCHNCLYVTEEYDPCMGCTLFVGPVAPEGWCRTWAAQV